MRPNAALALIGRGLYAEALKALGRRGAAAAVQPLRLRAEAGDLDALVHLGRAHLLANQAFAAVAVLERARAEMPGRADVVETLVGAYRRDARYGDAVELAGTVAPTPQILYEKGTALAHLGDAEAALAAFDGALALDPALAAAWMGSHAAALDAVGEAEAWRRLDQALACSGVNGKYWAFPYAYARLRGEQARAEALWAAHLSHQPRRRALAEGADALVPHLAPDLRLFGVAAPLLRHALERARGEGLVLEFGVRRGTSLTQIAQACPAVEVHGFDSFEGLPEGWGGEPRGVLTTGAQLPPVPANARLHAGWFEDSLDPFLAAHAGPVRFVNVDSDIYASARFVLGRLAPRLVPGSVVVFDEFIGNRTWRDDEFRAWAEHVAETGTRFRVFAVAPFTKQVAILVTGVGDSAGGLGV